MSDDYDEWERYDRPGLLIGPLPMKPAPGGGWVPDYSHPGVKERVAALVDFVEDGAYSKWKL